MLEDFISHLPVILFFALIIILNRLRKGGDKDD